MSDAAGPAVPPYPIAAKANVSSSLSTRPLHVGAGARRGLSVVLTLTIFASVLGVVYYYHVQNPRRHGLAQPIPFSHRFHAGQKLIGCFMCHPGAMDSPHAGVPPAQRCMLCHERIIVTFPAIQDLRGHVERDEPILWRRVFSIPDYVYFSHERHVRSGVDCSRCHGDVRAMDRVVQPREFTMGFCVQCHRDNTVSHDCLRCHR